MTKLEPEYWKTKALTDMSKAEWEALCDGFGKCCLNKLQDEETEELFFTDVACRLLDLKTCLCRNYVDRQRIVPECQILTSRNINDFTWLPSTCGYRLVSEGKDLEAWHPLLTGDSESVHWAGISVRGRVKSESEVWDIENHIVKWPE